MALVFQYGSNNSPSRLNSHDRLGGAAVPLSLARTADLFDLAFTRLSKRQGYAVADLVPGGRRIYGVVYDIPDSRIYRNTTSTLLTLDQIEGEGKSYRRTPIMVERLDVNQVVETITYLVISRVSGLHTSPQYVAHIIAGLREFNAPGEYIDYVKARAIESVPAERDAISAI
jgi:hypothetical protein